MNIYYEVGVTQKCTLLHLGMYQYKKINMKKKTNKIFMYLKKRNIILVTLLLFCFSPYALNDR